MAITCSGKFAAVSAIVIGGNKEHGVRINRLAVKGQVLNPLCIGINHLTFTVIAGGLGNINLIIHAINHIKVIGAETIPVDQRLWFRAVRINLVKLSGGALQPLFHLFTAGFHHNQRIGIEIKIGGITEGQLTFFHLHIACRVIFATTNFKRCGS